MNIALATNRGMLAACFSGTELWVIDSNDGIEKHGTIETDDLQPVFWSRELMRNNVAALLCAGIDQFTLGALKGNGIEVVQLAASSVEEALKQWRSMEETG